MKPIARLGDIETTFLGVRPITLCAARGVYVDNRPAAAIGDKVTKFVAVTGSRSVFVGNRPAHRLGDKNSGGGVCITASNTVYVQ